MTTTRQSTTRLTTNRDRHHPLSRRWRKWANALAKSQPNVEPKANRLNSAYYLPFYPALSRDERSDLRAQWRAEIAAA